MTIAQTGLPASGPLQLRLAQAYAPPASLVSRDASRGPDTFTRTMPDKARGLLAGAVTTPASPDAAATPAAGPALPFYRRPADRNTAATAILAGRTLDVNA